MEQSLLIRARTVLPVTAPPVDDGAVWIRDGVVEWVGRFSDSPSGIGKVLDLGEVLLLPGLVNAHAHLDYTHLAGMLAPSKSFPDWIKSIFAAKSQWGFSEFADSWLAGARQCLRHGTTTVANMESVPEMLAEVRESTPLRVYSFLEMTSLRSDPGSDQAVLETALERCAELGFGPGCFGLAPHAPYSTTPELLRLAGNWMRTRGGRLSIHVAESESESEMYLRRRGPMYQWLERQRSMADCGHGSPVRALEAAGVLGPGLIAVHANYLWLDDSRLLGESGTHVAHCPQSHAYFRHRHFPRSEIESAGVNICLGTDSLASTRVSGGKPSELSLWDELAALRQVDSDIPPESQLKMITHNGALALGSGGRSGCIQHGAAADFCVLEDFGGLASDPITRAVHHRGPVHAVMIGGKWISAPPASRQPLARAFA